MPNTPTEDRYNPAPIGSEFESHLFDDINIGEIFRLYDNNNEETQLYRKETETEAMNVKTREVFVQGKRTIVYIKI
jgi:hypothetical protein